MLEWLQEEYVVQAGDIALSFVGRGYNCATRRFENVSGKDLSRSQDTDFELRTFQLWIMTTARAQKLGVLGELYVVADPQATYRTVKLPAQEPQTTGAGSIRWEGEFPLCAGILFRVASSALSATDIVAVMAGYEKGRRHGR